MKPETRFKEKVLKELKRVPMTWAVKVQQTSIRGTPDILACVAGFFVALELKVDDSLDALQRYNLAKISDAGGLAYEVTPVNWPVVYARLNALACERLAICR